MTELLSELKEACQAAPAAASDDETLARGGSTWLRGLPARAEEGTVALGLGRETRVVVRESDIRTVTKDGEYYDVEVSSDANLLLRIEKPLRATPQPDCGCKGSDRSTYEGRRERPIDLEIGPITVCELLCADIVVDNGKQSVRYEICIPVNCYVESRSSG